MTDYLLTAILIMLILNGDWPARVYRCVVGLGRRTVRDVRRRWRNAKANRRKRRMMT